MNTAYRLALPELLPRYLGETYALGERLEIAAPAPNSAFYFERYFCLLKPDEISIVPVVEATVKVYWETGTEADVDFAAYPPDYLRFFLSFVIPANAQVGRVYGMFSDTNGAAYQMDPVQVVVRR